MAASTVESDAPGSFMGDVRALMLPGVVLWLLMAVVAFLTKNFGYGTELKDCPTLVTVAVLTAAFIVSLWAIRVALAARVQSLAAVMVFALALRFLMLMTSPILEVDIYRYMWDGLVVSEGISPYAHSPAAVLRANPASENDELRQLALLRARSRAIDVTLQRIHFGEITTVYPPVSQAVFAAAAWTTPDSFSIEGRLGVMKGWLILFDMGTLLIVGLLLREAGKPMGWAIAYGWCPLVLKEFANSGHLDSIAVFFSTLAVWLLIRSGKQGVTHFALALLALVLGVGAKLFPIVLLPLFLMRAWNRLGFIRATGLGMVCLALCVGSIWPMLSKGESKPAPRTTITWQTDPSMPPLPTTQPKPPAEAGLTAFLSRWEMNDFLFAIAYENVRPVGNRAIARQSWCAVVPDAWRVQLCQMCVDRLGLEPHLTPFLVARTLTSLVFLVIAVWLAVANRGSATERVLECAFLTLAWFWLLSPTQNPWYWAWALPLVAFTRNRAWLLMPGFAMVYYLRFWFRTLGEEPLFESLPYNGTQVFDQFVPWLEFGPLLAFILVLWIHRTWTGDRVNRV